MGVNGVIPDFDTFGPVFAADAPFSTALRGGHGLVAGLIVVT